MMPSSGDWPVPRPHQMWTKALSPSPGLCPAFKEPSRRCLRAATVFCCAALPHYPMPHYSAVRPSGRTKDAVSL
ncbi:hypothetical protein FKV68_01170 [Sinorhizobium mexicanum]|uniref:Uncharacterized protein n=1 Tax=Sinorhizobium mexicanum TaxID=375549 RepID=A0A859QJU2_9HYPH|nr:hypothetical protein FKV68_01170 [Sinorhizobium mexicanum]